MARARILVVDDEPDVLRMVAILLERAGYETVTAPGALQALGILTIKGGFDLVVSDVIMPEMCGRELAEKIRRLSPSSAILIMSGSGGHLPKGISFIGKPFSSSDLLRAVERVLGRMAASQP